jgi:hypothetical protein
LDADFPDSPVREAVAVQHQGYLKNQANLRSIAFYGDALDYCFVNFMVVLFRLASLPGTAVIIPRFR